MGKSAGRDPSSRVRPWHLQYNRGKNAVKPQSGKKHGKMNDKE